MIHIIYKILVLIKNHLNYLKYNTVECFFKKHKRFLSFLKFFLFHDKIMENLSPEEEDIPKDIRNLFRLKMKIKIIKDAVLGNIKNLFEYEKEENFYKPVRADNFWSNNYIEYKSNGNKNKILSVREYLNKIRPYFKGIINNLKTSDMWEIQLTITSNCISSLDNGEDRVMHSKNYNIEIMISDEADEVIKELFNSLKKRYQIKIESMKGSQFLFDYVWLLHHKCHKINPNCGGSYINSHDWKMINEKATINPINKKNNKCFQYAATVALNHEEIKKIHKK